MAESQLPYKYQGSSHLLLSLSKDRFTPYLKSAGYSEEYAFNLYLYNARLSKAFLFPLHVLEVSLRNHMSAIFSAEFGSNWLHEPGFRTALSKGSSEALSKGITRAKSDDLNDVVATLTFDFWSNLFRPEYDRPFWQTHMSDLLPYSEKTTRKEFQKIVRDLNKFRNRIAHHEPIHRENTSAQHTLILKVISWLCEETAAWVKHYSTVNQVVRTRPSKDGESAPFFKDRCDDDFKPVSESIGLDQLPASRFLLCHDASGELSAVVEAQHIAAYLLSLREERELIVDLGEHKVSRLIKTQGLTDNFSVCGGTESLSKASNILKKSISYIIVKDDVVLGVVAKAHRRYWF